jgi:gamma-glutamyltranspeptidase/glutathione hydrolase
MLSGSVRAVSEIGPHATRYALEGMVCSVDHVASSAGISMLRRGGSAADAAVATSAVLAVTSPHLCGMGGDLFALVHTKGTPVALNASGRAGSGADAARLRDEGATTMPFRGDLRSAPVPGCVDGWLALHGRFGRLPLAEVLRPALQLASEGFAVSSLLAALLPLVDDVPGADDFFTPRASQAGQPCVRPGTARALQAIIAEGRAGFYGGEFGEGLLEIGRGEYQADDLDRSQADWVEPIRVEVWDHDVWTVPPNSQGYLTLSAAWIASGLDLPRDPDDGEWAHLLVEAARQAGFDRDEVLHEDADGAALIDQVRLQPRRDAIRRDAVSALGAGVGAGDTIYLCAVDRDRMGVSLIQSNAADFGAHVVEPHTGTFLHNRGIGFSLQPSHPAEYAPGRRPPSTLSPALVTTRDGELRAVTGTMGGDSQPQIVLQLIMRLLQAGQRPGTIVSAPRFVLANHAATNGFSTWADLGALGVDVEGDAPARWVEGLQQRGHTVRVRRPLDHGFGHAHLIEVVGGALAAMADPRSGAGAAVGY